MSGAAERLLGHPVARWRDHDFEYRACTAQGGVVRLHDVVMVVRGARGVPDRLRGIMLPVREGEGPRPGG